MAAREPGPSCAYARNTPSSGVSAIGLVICGGARLAVISGPFQAQDSYRNRLSAKSWAWVWLLGSHNMLGIQGRAAGKSG